MYVCACEYVHRSAGTFRYQRHWIPLELTLQVVVSDPLWELGAKLRYSGRAVCDLNLQTISPAASILIQIQDKASFETGERDPCVKVLLPVPK